MKILVFSPPFEGHLNILRNLIRHHPSITWKVVITGWENIPCNLTGIEPVSVPLTAAALHETDPAQWTLPRVVELLDDCLRITREFQPDRIIYDFFSLEGYWAGKLTGIPVWSSVPAFIGPYADHTYIHAKLALSANVKALETLRDKYTVQIDPGDFEQVSDGLHLPGDLNLVWSYASVAPANYMYGRHDAPYVFIGNPNQAPKGSRRTPSHRPSIYVSFGTVVMNNLWNQQASSRAAMLSFMRRLADLWHHAPWDIILVTQGKQLLDKYPPGWRVEQTVDQPAELRKSDVFVTHAGSNSFHESLVAGTPMVAIPFFGDQPLVAESIARLGIGINLVEQASVDTHSKRDYLGPDLADKLDSAVRNILTHPSYQRAIHAVDLHHVDIADLLNGRISFGEGDLLFGTNIARKRYVQRNNLQNEFTILEFKAFSELAPHAQSLPRIVDIYHDVILSDEYFHKDTATGMEPYTRHLKEYKDYLDGETDFEKMCIKGIDYFTRFYHIHFLLDDYDPRVNRITRAEIMYILDHWQQFAGRVTFYQSIDGLQVPVTLNNVRTLNLYR